MTLKKTRTISKKLVVVLALRYSEALQWARESGLERNDFIHVSDLRDIDKVRGVLVSSIVRLGTYSGIPNIGEIEYRLKVFCKIPKESEETPISVPWHDEPVFMLGVNVGLYHLETGFHIYCCDWLNRERIKGWHHSANEAHKTRQGGILAKRMGQSPGIPDFMFFREKPFVIELKVGKNSLSHEQEDWFKHLSKCGWQCFEVTKFNDFEKIVRIHANTKRLYSGTGLFQP